MFTFKLRQDRGYFHYAGRLFAVLLTIAMIGGAAYLVKLAWSWAF